MYQYVYQFSIGGTVNVTVSTHLIESTKCSLFLFWPLSFSLFLLPDQCHAFSFGGANIDHLHSLISKYTHTHNSNPQTFSSLLVSTTAIRIPLRQAFPLLRNSFQRHTLFFPMHSFTSPLSIFHPISLSLKETT